MDLIKLTEDNEKLSAENARISAELATANDAKESALKEYSEYKETAEKVALEKADIEKALSDFTEKANAEKAELEAQITNLKASQADFDKAVGAKVIEITGKGGNKAAEGQHESKQSKTVTRQEFEAMSHVERNKYIREGGKVQE